MPLFPWVVGQTHPIWSLTWKDDSGAVVDLTGATLSLRIRLGGAGQGVAGGGVITVTNASGGLFTYAPVAGDFPQPGQLDVQFKAVYGDGTVLYHDVLVGPVLAAV